MDMYCLRSYLIGDSRSEQSQKGSFGGLISGIRESQAEIQCFGYIKRRISTVASLPLASVCSNSDSADLSFHHHVTIAGPNDALA